MTFNRFEVIGGIISVACLALALWLIRVETTNSAITTQDSTDSQTAAVVVAGDNSADLREAFSDAANDAGGLNRMIVNDVVIGAGEVVKEGDIITVHYKGMLQNGQEFDNSYHRGEPISFEVGAGRVIAGWDEGVKGMKVGGQRILVIPPQLAYGADGYGPIPANATLVFTVELVSIE